VSAPGAAGAGRKGKARTLRETLEGGERLPAVPLLDADVDVLGLGAHVLGVPEVYFIGERVCGGADQRPIARAGRPTGGDKPKVWRF
jgi:hypothetical protein